MADNVNRADGFRLVGTTHGRLPSIRKYDVSAHSGALYVGDPVVLSGTGSTAGIPGVVKASVSSTITGIFMGKVPTSGVTAPAIPTVSYIADGGSATIYVCDDPQAIFEIQEDSVGGNIAATALGEFCDVTFGAGNANTEMSGCILDSSDAATGDNVRLLSVVQRPDNVFGNTYCRFLVTINEHTYNAVQTPK